MRFAHIRARGASVITETAITIGAVHVLIEGEALQEIGLAIAPAFPADARFSAAKELTAISVKLDGGRMIVVRFSPSALRKYAVTHPLARQLGMQAIRSLCEQQLLDPIGKRSGHRIIEAAIGLEAALNQAPLW